MKAQPHLRGVPGCGRDLRSTDQGTSGRRVSQTSTPSECFSNKMASSSPHFLPQQNMLDKCPTDVLQFDARDRFSSADSPVQKARGSMSPSHHIVWNKSTPASGHTVWCNPSMLTREQRSEIRRENLRKYCVKYLGGPHTERSVMKALKAKTGHSKSSYVNDLLAEGSTKGIAEEAAQKFEHSLGLIAGQLSEPHSQLLLDPLKLDTAKNRLLETIEPMSNAECMKVLEYIGAMKRRARA